MRKPKINPFPKIIEAFFLVLFLFTPLILTPWNFELFEFNKMIFVYLLATLITGAWIGRCVCEKQLCFRRSFWDIPLLVFLVSQLSGTLFSLHPHTSFWGYYTRGHGGLASTMAYLFLYWALVSNTDRKQAKQYLKTILLGGILVAGYGVLERLGIDRNYWQQDVQNRVFSTLGQPNWLAAWLGLIFFVPITFYFDQKKRRLLPALAGGLFYLCLLFTKSRSGLIALLTAWPVFWYLVSRSQKRAATAKKTRQLVIFTTILLMIGLFGIDNPVREYVFTRLGLQPISQLPPGILISESGNIRQVVWNGAIEVWKHAPLTGTGTETFAYSYYNYRPAAHNLLSEWDFLYNKAHNEYLNFLANNGLIGLASYMGLIGSFGYWIIRNRTGRHRQSLFLTALAAGYLHLLITNFFGFSVVATGLLFFLFPALGFCLASKNSTQSKNIHLPRLKLIMIGAVTAVIVLRIGQIWYADTRLAASDENLQDGLSYLSLENIQTAIRLRPNEPVFRDRYSVIASTIALQAHQQEQATLSAQLAQTSLEESARALSLNPYHLNFWKNAARNYLVLAEIEPSLLLKAAETLEDAAKLAPTDAKIYYNLGLIYDQLDQRERAITTLQKAISLKPNYKDARFAVAYFYHQQKNDPEAVAELVYIRDRIDPTDQIITKLINEWQP